MLGLYQIASVYWDIGVHRKAWNNAWSFWLWLSSKMLCIPVEKDSTNFAIGRRLSRRLSTVRRILFGSIGTPSRYTWSSGNTLEISILTSSSWRLGQSDCATLSRLWQVSNGDAWHILQLRGQLSHLQGRGAHGGSSEWLSCEGRSGRDKCGKDGDLHLFNILTSERENERTATVWEQPPIWEDNFTSM